MWTWLENLLQIIGTYGFPLVGAAGHRPRELECQGARRVAGTGEEIGRVNAAKNNNAIQQDQPRKISDVHRTQLIGAAR